MKVKIVELYVSELSYQDDYDYNSKLFYSPLDVTDWEEVDDEEFRYLKLWIDTQNRQYGKKKYVLAIESDLSPLKKARDLIAEHKKQMAAAEKHRAKMDAELAEKALKRKRKQLEKLKVELGEK